MAAATAMCRSSRSILAAQAGQTGTMSVLSESASRPVIATPTAAPVIRLSNEE